MGYELHVAGPMGNPNVTKVLVEKFDIKPTGEVKEDVAAIMNAA
jgi:hydroxylamine reductase (hybrid-cluster protein)